MIGDGERRTASFAGKVAIVSGFGGAFLGFDAGFDEWGLGGGILFGLIGLALLMVVGFFLGLGVGSLIFEPHARAEFGARLLILCIITFIPVLIYLTWNLGN